MSSEFVDQGIAHDTVFDSRLFYNLGTPNIPWPK